MYREDAEDAEVFGLFIKRRIPCRRCATLKLISKPTGWPPSFKWEISCALWTPRSCSTAFSSMTTCSSTNNPVCTPHRIQAHRNGVAIQPGGAPSNQLCEARVAGKARRCFQIGQGQARCGRGG